jgi:hypothetical protein
MNAKKLLVALAIALFGAPLATAGADTGIGIPAGRDATPQSVPLVTEHTWRVPRGSQPTFFLSENTKGQSRVPLPASAAPVLTGPNAGFDWSDAGVGAGITLASLLCASAAALAIRRRGLPAH